jgi:hypothetical protein
MDDTPARKGEPGMDIARRQDEAASASDDGNNRDKVWEGKTPASYKSVISGIFGSDFSWKCLDLHRNTI